MDFKISFKCGNCNAKFELTSEMPSNKCSLECPCCGMKYPDEEWGKLKSAILNLSNIPAIISKCDNELEKNFNYEFKQSLKEWHMLTDIAEQ